MTTENITIYIQRTLPKINEERSVQDKKNRHYFANILVWTKQLRAEPGHLCKFCAFSKDIYYFLYSLFTLACRDESIREETRAFVIT